ncbi:receptor-like protein 12 [Canna indica]|uniref:Receptor-like protein 12 n=1 Tax=Canna indica TaxID=4628 RepID=A0AAQ3K6Z5_9LILI|nr:receptor-like protein 12 [Canna indica]
MLSRKARARGPLLLHDRNNADDGEGGNIPSSIGNLERLEFLHLNSNSPHGDIPSSLQNCRIAEDEVDEEEFEMLLLHIAIALGFWIGLWSVLTIL